MGKGLVWGDEVRGKTVDYGYEVGVWGKQLFKTGFFSVLNNGFLSFAE